jgi:magnesium transporter
MAQQTLIRTVASIAGISIERGVSVAEAREHLAEPDNVVWMDVQAPGPEEIAMLCAEFELHPMSLKDAASGLHRPKIEDVRHYLGMVTYSVLPGATDVHVELTEIDLFVGPNFIVTVHSVPVPAIDDAMLRWTRGGAMLREGVGYPFYCVLDAVISGFAPTITAIENVVQDSRIDSTSSDEGNVERLLALKRTLYSLRRVLYPMRESLQLLLRREPRPYAPAVAIYFEDVRDEILRLNDLLGMELDMLNGTLDAHLTLISSRLNRTMRTLTLVTVAIGFAGLIFAGWGMNIEQLPFRHSPWGFWALWGLNILLVGVAFAISRKRGWF